MVLGGYLVPAGTVLVTPALDTDHLDNNLHEARHAL